MCRSVGHLGSGQFANVEEGTWKKGVDKEVRVALKTMKPGSTEEDKIEFLQDAAIMAQFQHPNVVVSVWNCEQRGACKCVRGVCIKWWLSGCVMKMSEYLFL